MSNSSDDGRLQESLTALQCSHVQRTRDLQESLTAFQIPFEQSSQGLLDIQSEAIKQFETGRKPLDIVKSGVCGIDEAEFLYRQYTELKRFSEGVGREKVRPDLENMVEKLSTQTGLLGSRPARVELKILNSYILPKTEKCSKCGEEGPYAVGTICTDCGNVDAHLPDDIHRLSIKDVNLKGYRPWEGK